MLNFVYKKGIVFFLVVAGSAACTSSDSSGPQRFLVEGSVKLDGKPLEAGTIFFLPMNDGGTGSSTEIKNGAFQIDNEDHGLSLGNYRIEITSMKKTGKTTPGPGPDGQVEEMVQVIPARYNTKTDLEATVQKKDVNRFEFTLTTK